MNYLHKFSVKQSGNLDVQKLLEEINQRKSLKDLVEYYQVFNDCIKAYCNNIIYIEIIYSCEYLIIYEIRNICNGINYIQCE